MPASVSWLPGTQLFSVYQPIVDRGGQPIGFEALVRGVRGGLDLGAASLFARAQDSGAERLLDRRAAEAAVRGATGWLDSRLLFVNVAPVSLLAAAAWLDELLSHLDHLALPPGQVVVELNEHQRLAGNPDLVRLLHHARSAGLQIALDDVLGDDDTEQGCRAVRPDYLKVDGSVVAGLGELDGLVPLQRVMRAAAEVGATVIAEQVETQAQLELLHAHGIDLVQGWLTGPPVRVGIPAQPTGRPELRLVL